MSPRPWKLSPADKDAIRTAYAAGQLARDLAEQYSVSPASIYNVLNAGKPRRVQPPRTRVTTAAQDQRPYRDSTHGYVKSDCEHTFCGMPGLRRHQALTLTMRDGTVITFCSWHCLSRHAIRRELAGGDAA